MWHMPAGIWHKGKGYDSLTNLDESPAPNLACKSRNSMDKRRLQSKKRIEVIHKTNRSVRFPFVLISTYS